MDAKLLMDTGTVVKGFRGLPTGEKDSGMTKILKRQQAMDDGASVAEGICRPPTQEAQGYSYGSAFY